MATYDQFQSWPKDIHRQEAKKQWVLLSSQQLIDALTKYHDEWQNLLRSKSSEAEVLQILTYKVKLYEQVESVNQISLQSLSNSIQQTNLLSQKSVEIQNLKEEMIRSLESRLQDQTNALLNQQEISSILFEDVKKLESINTQLTKEKNDLIKQYKEIQKCQQLLNQKLEKYKENTQSNKIEQLDYIQADIQKVIGLSEKLIDLIGNLIQNNQKNASEELIQERLQNLKKILTYNNKLLRQLSQYLYESEVQLILVQQKNENLQKEILNKTNEIEEIQRRLRTQTQQYQQAMQQQASQIDSMMPADYDSHRTKSQRIEKSLNNMKNHFCEFGCNLFLRILNDCQTQIKAFNNQELETLLLDQIKELQKISNLEQQEKLLQGNLKILEKFNSETLVINKDILKEVQNMLQNIRSLQEQVNYR